MSLGPGICEDNLPVLDSGSLFNQYNSQRDTKKTEPINCGLCASYCITPGNRVIYSNNKPQFPQIPEPKHGIKRQKLAMLLSYGIRS